MRSLFLLPALLLLSGGVSISGGATPSAPAVGAQQGVPALQGVTPRTVGYLKATPVAGNPLSETLDFWMTPLNSTVPIRGYQVEMTKKIHIVIVSDDFKTFMHIHPTLTATGHFKFDDGPQKFPAPGMYHVYADGIPDKMNDHQVFRFDLPVGNATASVQRKLPATGMGVNVGPYEVDMSTLHLTAGSMSMIDVNILKDGKPVKDLHPYLGSPAHAVFLNSKDLSYVHVHPMAMDASMDMSKPAAVLADTASVSGEMMLMVSLKEAGTYKLWLQFKGADGKLYVAEFTMQAT